MDPGPVASQLLSLSCFVVLLHLLWRSSGGLPGNKAASLLWGCCAWLWTSQTILHKLKGSFRSFWVMCQWKVTGRTWGLEKGQGSWSEQQNRKQHTPRLKCREKQIKAHICRLPCLPAFSCLDLKVIGSQGGDSWRKLRGGESIYLQWDAATLIQDAVSCRMCLPPSSTNTHMLKNTHTHTSSVSSPPSHYYNPWVCSSIGSGLLREKVTGEEGVDLLQGRAACIVWEAGSHSACLPVWLRRWWSTFRY